MKPFETIARVGSDGNLIVPVGIADAGAEVIVRVAPAPPKMTQEQWVEFVDRTAGSISDPTFCRPEQGAFEQRDALE